MSISLRMHGTCPILRFGERTEGKWRFGIRNCDLGIGGLWPPASPKMVGSAAVESGTASHRDREKAAVEGLIRLDSDFSIIVGKWGLPPRWRRAPGFATLVHIILEQQVSLASARAAFDRLAALLEEITPKALLGLSDLELLRCGFSRQKTRYCRALAKDLTEGSLDLESLEKLDDRAACERLQKVKGIGRWTAEIYLLMALGRTDIFPIGDLALVKAIRTLKEMPENPSKESLQHLAEGWRPWRSTAARLLWHFYLSGGVPSRA